MHMCRGGGPQHTRRYIHVDRYIHRCTDRKYVSCIASVGLAQALCCSVGDH